MSTARRYLKGGTLDLHVEIAARVLGKPLPKGAQVHHVDGNPLNNELTNLVICPSQAYHRLLHKRQRALETCGNADWVNCRWCKQWGPPTELYVNKRYAHHVSCQNAWQRKYRWEKGICQPR